jgi:dTDP-glucose pyrophosphorylase
VSEYLISRMLIGGATKLCIVIAPGKSDIIEYYGGSIAGAHVCYAVQPAPLGLCDAIFRAAPLIQPDERVLVGLPDTVWFPADGYRLLGDEELSFLSFPVAQPELFDAVLADDDGNVLGIDVKQRAARSRWVWGAFKLRGHVLHRLHRLWRGREPRDVYFGTLVNHYLGLGGRAVAVGEGEAYVDVGTLHGYREAIELLATRPPEQRPYRALLGASEEVSP